MGHWQQFNLQTLVLFFMSIMMISSCSDSQNGDDRIGRGEGRIWEEVRFEQLSGFEELNEHLSNPVKIRIAGNEIYIVDRGVNQILQFSDSGELINTIGNGTGRGPGEFLSVSSIDVDGDHIWVADSQLAKIDQFTLSGDPVKTMSLDERPYSIAVSGRDLYAHFSSPSISFAKLDSAGQISEEIKLELIDGNNFMAFSGSIKSTSYGDGFYYLPVYSNHIYSYRPGEMISRFIEHPEETEFPAVDEHQSNGAQVSPGLSIPNRFFYAGSGGDRLYMNSFFTGVMN